MNPDWPPILGPNTAPLGCFRCSARLGQINFDWHPNLIEAVLFEMVGESRPASLTLNLG